MARRQDFYLDKIRWNEILQNEILHSVTLHICLDIQHQQSLSPKT